MAAKNALPRVLISIVLIVGSILAIAYFKKTRVSNAPRPITIAAIDIETRKVVDVVKKPGEKWPLKNPKTGRRTLYMAYVSRDDKIIFPGKGVVTVSPVSGSSNVGAVGDNQEYKKYPVVMEGFNP